MEEEKKTQVATEEKEESDKIKKAKPVAVKPEKRHRGQGKKDEKPQEKKTLAAPLQATDAKAPEEVKAEVFSGDKFCELPINDKLK